MRQRRLSIGGWVIDVVADRRSDFELYWEHESFVQVDCSAPADFVLDVAMEYPPLFDVESFRGQSWSAVRDGEALWIIWDPLHAKQRYDWAVRISPGLDGGKLFLNPDVYAPGKGRYAEMIEYPLAQILMMFVSLHRDSVIVHSAGGKLFGKGLVFPGVSGAGKSTIAGILRDEAAATWFSDDRMLLREDGGRWWACGTPWSGDQKIALNEASSLDALLFLTQHGRSEIVPLDRAEALRRLMPVTSIPLFDRKYTDKALDVLSSLISAVPAFELRFLPDDSVTAVVKAFAEAS